MEKSRRIIAIAALGVLLSGAVTASFLGAFHSPAPHRVPVGFVGPPATKTRVLSSLGAGPPGAFDVRAYPTARAVETAVEHQRLDGALVVPPRGAVTVVIASAAGSAPTGLVSTVLGQAASSLGRPVTTRDVAPLAPADREGLSVFFLVLAILLPSLLVGVGTSLAASSVAPSVQAAALVATAATLGFGAAAIAGPGLGAVDGHFLGIGLEAALVCLAIAMSSALLARLAPVGGVVSLVLFVVIGVPAAGGPAGLERFVPAFFRDLAPYLPTSGAVSILRSTTYFHGLGMWPDAWVLVAWAGAGLLGLTALGRRGPSEGLHRTRTIGVATAVTS